MAAFYVCQKPRFTIQVSVYFLPCTLYLLGTSSQELHLTKQSGELN